MKKILICVGTRPNLIKITQFEKHLKASKKFEYRLLHTGQHYDYKMNKIFFDELKIKKPDVFLNTKTGSQISVITQIMNNVETFLLDYKPDLVLVPGDVNSTFACAFTANRLGFKVAHIESGLRSFDRKMPEEINRILTDNLSDLYFVTEPSGYKHLLDEGKKEKQIHYVGNTMIDTLIAFRDKINSNKIIEELNLEEKNYALLTFHRPRNVDNKENLSEIVDLIRELANKITLVFPIHHRTKKNIEKYGFQEALNHKNIKLIEAQGYFEFIKLIQSSKMVITDSGGIQEESTFLKIPCLTVRPNTERPVTITEGTNTLLGLQPNKILSYVDKIIDGNYKKGAIPDKWDGKATERIVKVLEDIL